ncbi:hypothetical protein AURDEDRAFT_111528 [Auricularia subglabra TFB-10046 SS5]|nr:hypothetical protein AURDEDRAFT_111528 [Auricularia subglabra TFB-10046 SS5]
MIEQVWRGVQRSALDVQEICGSSRRHPSAPNHRASRRRRQSCTPFQPHAFNECCKRSTPISGSHSDTRRIWLLLQPIRRTASTVSVSDRQSTPRAPKRTGR